MKRLAVLKPLLAIALLLRATGSLGAESSVSDAPTAQAVGDGRDGMDPHDPAHAVAQLDVSPDLAVGLFAAEPLLSNPASIDVDHLGRVWVCEAINYRVFNNADVIGDRREGDRILVLEDSDGDAVADKSTVFYQGHDVDSAHGVMVMPTATGRGTKAIVSAKDSVFILVDDDGDLKADRKELLFTGIDGVEHDHGIHAFHFGPDGKLYFNFGNAGKHIKDKAGMPIVDKMGHEVNDSRQPYQEGMVFRSNVDGSEFETLAWNFRNNWEVCVDSFGTMWQSDNDDDGNLGCRINYVMEYGNYGYKDELTGAAWSEPRTNWEAENSRRHWHLNDPGVVPNVLQTGAGAPTGICVYEGDLLPSRFRGALIHTDAGLNLCRAYVTKADGAGYTAETVGILDGSRNKWFRPSDVCVAPDGSLLVADWYDPGVGGHRMEDVRRGRVFRVTRTGTSESQYKVSAVDVSSPEGAVAALKSPNMATRYLAWTALRSLGQRAAPALREMSNSENSVFRARATWLLGKLDGPPGSVAAVVQHALGDKDSDLRVVGVRLARQTARPQGLIALVKSIDVNARTPAVRREVLIGMHEIKPQGPTAEVQEGALTHKWVQLARLYDGADRWYLEALGIAAEGRWGPLLLRLPRDLGPDWRMGKPGRDILWRSRGESASALIAAAIADPQTPDAEAPRFLRALDFQPVEAKQRALPDLAFSEHPDLSDDRRALIRSESFIRLDGFDASKGAQYQAALEKVLDQCAGSEQFIRLVDKFSVATRYADLLGLAQAQPGSQLAVDAMTVLYGKERYDLINAALTDQDPNVVEGTLAAMATASDPRGNAAVLSLLSDEQRPLALRRLAVKTLGATMSGALQLLELARQQEYPAQLQDATAATLNSARWPPVRETAAAMWPPPPTKDSTPLPPLSELFAMKGDGERGKIVFESTGTCSKCHQTNGAGKAIGPDLSEIGKKLAREAMFESILYPSAAISHNFGTVLVVTNDGLAQSGILVSETDAEIKLKDENGILRTIPMGEIDERSMSDVSLMPADIQKLMSAQELVDVVEYLSTLQQKR